VIAWMSVLVPLLVMFFALGMERVESRLRPSEPEVRTKATTQVKASGKRIF
jgi:hypothetical protein